MHLAQQPVLKFKASFEAFVVRSDRSRPPSLGPRRVDKNVSQTPAEALIATPARGSSTNWSTLLFSVSLRLRRSSLPPRTEGILPPKCIACVWSVITRSGLTGCSLESEDLPGFVAETGKEKTILNKI